MFLLIGSSYKIHEKLVGFEVVVSSTSKKNSRSTLRLRRIGQLLSHKLLPNSTTSHPSLHNYLQHSTLPPQYIVQLHGSHAYISTNHFPNLCHPIPLLFLFLYLLVQDYLRGGLSQIKPLIVFCGFPLSYLLLCRIVNLV